MWAGMRFLGRRSVCRGRLCLIQCNGTLAAYEESDQPDCNDTDENQKEGHSISPVALMNADGFKVQLPPMPFHADAPVLIKRRERRRTRRFFIPAFHRSNYFAANVLPSVKAARCASRSASGAGTRPYSASGPSGPIIWSLRKNSTYSLRPGITPRCAFFT